MWFAGKDMTGKPPRSITETGMAHIPEDRQRYGLVLPYTVADNLVLNSYYLTPFAKSGILQPKPVDANAHKLIDDYDIRTPSPYISTSTLSGGNQQKVIVARELSHPIKLLIANQPTRGLDVGSIEYIHKEIVLMRDRGLGVLLVSQNWTRSWRSLIASQSCTVVKSSPRSTPIRSRVSNSVFGWPVRNQPVEKIA